MENFFELRDFDRNPELRKLVVNYCLSMYEENAIIDDEHLIKEYNWLKNNGKLNDLFLTEYINNEGRCRYPLFIRGKKSC